MMRLRLILVCAAIGFAGCRSATTPVGPPKEEEAVLRNLVTQMPDASRRPDSFRAFFTADATIPADAERARYAKLYFQTVGAPTIKGNSATIKVSVRDDDSPNPLGQMDWTFVKEGEQWKAKSAPLP